MNLKIEDLDLYSLKYFFDAVENGGVTQAAEKNYITRSAVSQAISRLEAWTGFALLTHKKRSFELTREGVVFYRNAKANYQVFEKSFQTESAEQRSLSIGCSASLVDSYLLPIVGQLNPLSALDLSMGTSRELKERLRKELIHIAIYVNEDSGAVENSSIIHNGKFVLVSRDGRLPRSIVTTEPRPEVEDLKRCLRASKVKDVNYFSCTSWSVALKIAKAVGGAALVPDLIDHGMKVVPVRSFKRRYDVVCSHVEKQKLSDLEVQMVDALKGR